MVAVDLFAGCGGSTEGATQAGARVVWAGDHWPIAVETHRANHPDVEHACQDLHQADWTRVPAHDLLLASPACQGHSRARGGKDRPHHDAARSTAWAVVSCAEYHRPRVVLVENVLEFSRWTLYRAWTQALRALGYRLSAVTVEGAALGMAQTRRRLFVVGVRGRRPLMIAPPQGVPSAADTIIRWDEGEWRSIEERERALTPRTLEQIRQGRARHGDRFVVPYYGTDRRRGATRSIRDPLGTITTRERYAVVDGEHMRMLSVREYAAAQGFPEDYVIPESPKQLGVMLLGNAVPPPMERWMVDQVREAA